MRALTCLLSASIHIVRFLSAETTRAGANVHYNAAMRDFGEDRVSRDVLFGIAYARRGSGKFARRRFQPLR